MSEVSATYGPAASAAPADPTEPLEPDASLGELLGRVSQDFGDLVSTQMELAKVEIKEEVGRAAKGAGFFGGGAVAGLLAVMLLSFALAWGLAEVMPAWVAFLIVGLVWAAVAAVLALQGRQQFQAATPVLPQTKESLKEDVEWARHQTS
jgi:uncharacterized membrane protein YqjE